MVKNLINNMQNRSKFLQLTPTILLEYIINENDIKNDNIDNNIFQLYDRNPIILDTPYNSNKTGVLKMFTEIKNDKLTNNNIFNVVVPTNEDNRIWFQPNTDNEDHYIERLSKYCNIDKINDNYNNIQTNTQIRYDSIKLHVLSGYSFGDIFGFMIQVKTFDKDHNEIKLCNHLYKRSNTAYIFEKPIIINNKIYDKYIEIKIPSSKDLRNIENPSDYFNSIAGEKALNLINSKVIENVEIIYSDVLKNSIETIYDDNYNVIGNTFRLENYIHVELPYESESDKFNIFLEEANNGNHINFYCTWENKPITLSTVNAFNTRIKLYSTNNNNIIEDNLDNLYDADNIDNIINSKNKWTIYHEIVTSCYNNNNQLIELPQTYNIQQSFNSSNINSPSIFRYMPIIDVANSSELSYITFEYTARLINSYDGTQIVRKGALTSFNVNRYISNISKINTDNITNYKVFNKINRVDTQIKNNVSIPKTKIIKEYVNYNSIILKDNTSNTIKLNKFGSKILFELKLLDKDENENYLDLLSNNTASYVIVYKDINEKLNEINCTYSENMNLRYGQLEFNISLKDTEKMMKVNDKTFAIKSKTLDGNSSTLIEINYEF